MKVHLILIAASLAYWIAAAVILVSLGNIWPWLTASPWLFVIFAPMLGLNLFLRGRLRKKLLTRGLP